MLHTRHCALTAVLIALASSGCQDSAGVPSTAPTLMRAQEDPPALVLHRVRPLDTGPATGSDAINWEPAIKPESAYHYAWVDPSNRSNPKLLVFLPGATNRPMDYQLVEQEAARLGYNVIGLMYQNNVGVDAVCKGTRVPTPPPECSGDTRLEILDGIDRLFSQVDVNPANSIDNRLTQLLKYLDEHFPDERWSRFLDRDAPKWSQIAVAGQSQGAGQAALIGKLRHVNRVVMLSGPPDARLPDAVDAWVSIGETPAEKYFALFHDRDLLVAGIRANLDALDMYRFGDPVLVTGKEGESPYAGTHILMTDLEPKGGYTNPNPHRSTARDAFTPPADGCAEIGPGCPPRLVDAWRYLMGEPPHGGSAEPLPSVP
jgi:hypothetical protein